VTNKSKYYFWDNGIRNAVIAQFNNLNQRADCGALWENFFMMEREKYRAYRSVIANVYFWRTYRQQEIDLIEEREGRLYAYECKWSSHNKVSAPTEWKENYPDSDFQVINPENYLNFV
jgi:predicted AAA+ superfamily ATPase